MEWFVRWFIRAALAWLGVGVLLGLAMVFEPAAYVALPAHMHANLLGFVSMMIFGVGYHVLPRFAGRPLHRRRWAEVHFVLANVGLALQVAGFLLRPFRYGPGTVVLATGAVLGAAGIALFIVNMWITVGPRLPLEVVARAESRARPAPVAGVHRTGGMA